jgi:hypothetical protein
MGLRIAMQKDQRRPFASDAAKQLGIISGSRRDSNPGNKSSVGIGFPRKHVGHKDKRDSFHDDLSWAEIGQNHRLLSASFLGTRIGS